MYRPHYNKGRNSNLKRRSRVKIKDSERNITFKESAIYRPLLTVFLSFLFVFIVLFPISIFDQFMPNVMSFFRRLVELTVYSAVGTLLTLPVSALDVKLIAIFGDPLRYTSFYSIFVLVFAVIADTFFAIVGYRFARNLSKLFVKKQKKLKDKETMNNLLDKYGSIAVFLAAATPLPFTVAVYYAGAIKFHFKKFIIFTGAGRLFKYSIFWLFLRMFNINIVELGQSIWEWFINLL